jgi:hypothetical protein
MRTLTLALALCLGVQAWPGSARAQVEADEAKRLFDLGVESLANQRWDDAEQQFRRSVELVRRASSLYNLALALFELRRFRECVEITDQVLAAADPTDPQKYREHAAQLRERALSALAVLTLSIEPENASVRVDGEDSATHGTERTLLLEPGVRRVAASAEGRSEQELLLELKAGERRQHTFKLQPLPAEPEQLARTSAAAATRPVSTGAPQDADTGAPASRSSRNTAWWVMGAGGAVLIGALVTGLIAHAADQDFIRQCPGAKQCDPALKPLQSRAQRLALATDLLLIAGTAAVGTGVTLWLLSDSDSESSVKRGSTRWSLRAAGVQLAGRL